jgi:hypothetical protein
MNIVLTWEWRAVRRQLSENHHWNISSCQIEWPIDLRELVTKQFRLVLWTEERNGFPDLVIISTMGLLKTCHLSGWFLPSMTFCHRSSSWVIPTFDHILSPTFIECVMELVVILSPLRLTRNSTLSSVRDLWTNDGHWEQPFALPEHFVHQHQIDGVRICWFGSLLIGENETKDPSRASASGQTYSRKTSRDYQRFPVTLWHHDYHSKDASISSRRKGVPLSCEEISIP